MERQVLDALVRVREVRAALAAGPGEDAAFDRLVADRAEALAAVQAVACSNGRAKRGHTAAEVRDAMERLTRAASALAPVHAERERWRAEREAELEAATTVVVRSLEARVPARARVGAVLGEDGAPVTLDVAAGRQSTLVRVIGDGRPVAFDVRPGVVHDDPAEWADLAAVAAAVAELLPASAEVAHALAGGVGRVEPARAA